MAFLDRLRVFQRAVSLGGTESLACHPASTTHAVVPQDVRARAGITEGLVRLSVGAEPLEVLMADVWDALDFAREVQKRLVPV
jgi:methionine-gamma-lyase